MASKIVGLGMYAPPKELTNFDLEQMVDTNDAWITERTGIRSRHIAEPGTGNSDLCVEAARKALDDAGVDPAELDIVVVGRSRPTCRSPPPRAFSRRRSGRPTPT
ncbi:MAG TPA: 3-oxoacyl-ACP synthase, partial [Thermodesulfobacteriota bacterium]|nr:3-oxoacyl-ACP synthase [Thermodesulfobacteriota bacterium]